MLLAGWSHGYFPVPNGKLAQVGLWFNVSSGDYPFLNYILDAGDFNNGDNTGDLDVSNQNANGFPTDATYVAAHGARTTFNVPSLTTKPGTYTVSFVGTGSINGVNINLSSPSSGCTATGGGSKTLTGTNCSAVATLGGTFISVIITSLGSPPITGLTFCYTTDCAKITSGQLFNPDFKAAVCSHFGAIRFLDKGNFNTSNEATWEDRKPTTYFSYAAGHYPAAMVTTNFVTLSSGAAYTLAFTGFSLVDKAHVIARLTSDITAYPATLNVNGTGAITLAGSNGAALASGTLHSTNGSFPVYSIFTYDQSLNVWIVGNSAFSNTGIGDGWPPEIMVRLANECAAHPHFPAPYLAVDPMTDYEANLMAYAKANLLTGLIPRYEGPNETWNYLFAATSYADNKEFLRTAATFDHDNWYGMVISQIGQLASTTYGADRTKYRVIAGMSAFDDGGLPTNGGGGQAHKLDSPAYVAEGGSAAYNWVTHIAPAGYWDTSFYNSLSETGWAYAYSISPSNALLDAYLAGSTTPASNFTLPVVNTMYGNFASYAASYTGIGLTQYEGGYSIGSAYVTNTQTANVTAVTTGNPTVLTVGTNAWNYICNTASLCTGGAPTAALSGFAGGCGLNTLDPAVTAATSTTITVNVDSTLFTGCTTGKAAYDGSNAYVQTFEMASQTYTGLTPYELTNLQNFFTAGGTFPAEYVLSGTNNPWAVFLPTIYATSPRAAAVDQYNQMPFLLKRDLSPANDNSVTPMFLNEAA